MYIVKSPVLGLQWAFLQKRKFKKMLLMKNNGLSLYKTKKSWGGCHHFSSVYVLKSPVLGLQWAFFQKSLKFEKGQWTKKPMGLFGCRFFVFQDRIMKVSS